ncbi:MAG: methyltransferase domain-containing protein [Gemmataceae bacterium]
MLAAVHAHHDLIDQMIARGALWSAALIAAFRATPRLYFLDRLWGPREGRWRAVDVDAPTEEDLAAVYADRAVTTRLSEDSVAVSSSSQPSLMAGMLEDLRLGRGQRVLEVGAGTGYNAALLAHVVGPVLSIDVDQQVLADARRHLARFPDREARLVHGDGREGWPEAAPFDRIQVTAATDDLEPAWLAQVRPGGVVQAPLDVGPGLAWVVQGEVTKGAFSGGLTRGAYFMPLRDEAESGRDRNVPAGPLPGPEGLIAAAPPWSKWSDLRPVGGGDFLTSLAVLAWLEGGTLGHASCPDGRAGYGVADPIREEACWLGPHEWRVTGEGGKRLGMDLWRRWLDLGAPRPNEWRLRAVPLGTPLDLDPAARAAYWRRGRRCEQAWELVEPRCRGSSD